MTRARPHVFDALVIAIVLTGLLLLVDLVCQVATGHACPWPWIPNPDAADGGTYEVDVWPE